MNKHIIMGRLTKDPEVRYGGSQNICVARFTLAVDRRYKRENQPTADFFQLTAFGKTGEFVEKYLHKGTKVLAECEIQNDNYEDKDHIKRYSFKWICNSIEFAESKKSQESNNAAGNTTSNSQQQASGEKNDDGFIDVPDSIDEKLPFA